MPSDYAAMAKKSKLEKHARPNTVEELFVCLYIYIYIPFDILIKCMFMHVLVEELSCYLAAAKHILFYCSLSHLANTINGLLSHCEVG